MRFLRNMPAWGWFMLILVNLYLIYNPFAGWAGLGDNYSLYHMWMEGTSSSMSLPVKIMLTAIIGGMAYLYFKAAYVAIGIRGKIFIAAIIGVLLWLLAEEGLYNPADISVWTWLTQVVLAVMFTVGIKWSKIWFAITGRRAVDDPDTVHPDDQ